MQKGVLVNKLLSLRRHLTQGKLAEKRKMAMGIKQNNNNFCLNAIKKLNFLCYHFSF
jgi:hypothetical protein